MSEKLEQQIKSIESPVPSAEFSQQLEQQLSDEAKSRNSKNGWLQNITFWRSSLAVASLILIVILLTTIFLSVDTRDEIYDYISGSADKSAESVETLVIIKGLDLAQDTQVLIYDLLQDADYVPLDIEPKYDDDELRLYLYPGLYKLVLVDGETIKTHEILVETNKSEVIIKL